MMGCEQKDKVAVEVLQPNNEEEVSLLPLYSAAPTFLVGDKLPCHDPNIKSCPMDEFLRMLNRRAWIEGLFVRKSDVDKIIRYQNLDGSYKHYFDDKQFLTWVKNIEDNIAICDMENQNVGKGVFVAPEKRLPKGTFIPSTGIIKLNPSHEDLATKVHCSALQDFNSREKNIYGLIDPNIKGGILDLINHAPDKNELVNFKFKDPAIITHVATSNLTSAIKFYQGYAIMGVEVVKEIEGGRYGTQLLWSYAQACEYVTPEPSNKAVLLFDNRPAHNGEIIDPRYYSLHTIDIYINTGKSLLKKVVSLIRWDIMDTSPDVTLMLSPEKYITYGLLQKYIKQNPLAERVILDMPALT